jgi:Transcriptional regulatory protein, C terminal
MLVGMRVYLTGALSVQHGSGLLPQRAFPGPQGRIVFAMLAADHGTPVSRDQLAEEVWRGSPPVGWEVAVRALVSKVRNLLEPVAGCPGDRLITAALGCYQLNLPDGAWVDLDAAGAAVHASETALANGEVNLAGSEALVTGPARCWPTSAAVSGSRRTWAPPRARRYRPCTWISCGRGERARPAQAHRCPGRTGGHDVSGERHRSGAGSERSAS